MKNIFLLLSFKSLFFIQALMAQTNPGNIIQPGLDKFTGRWQYINGVDTITMTVLIHYHNIEDSNYMKLIAAYYDYKSGNNFIHQNERNFSYLLKSDFMGSTPYGNANLDSIIVGGRDVLKRKEDEGVFIISNNNNQLKYKRYIGIMGGGVRFHKPGEGPLPGFTLPYEFIMTRIPIPSEEKGNTTKADQ